MFSATSGERMFVTAFSKTSAWTTARMAVVERGIARLQRVALEEHALAGRLLEPGVDDLVDAAGLARPGGVRVDLVVPSTRPSAKSAKTVREPAEDRDLAVAGAPAGHARRQVVLR